MPLEVTCPNCFKSHRFADEHAGRKTQCQACKHLFQIGNPEPAKQIDLSVTPKPKASPPKRRSKMRTGYKLPSSVNRPPGLVKILLDFNMRHYYTPWVVRASWKSAVLLFFASWFVSFVIFMVKLIPDLQLLAQQKMTANQLLREDGFLFAILLLAELVLLSLLMSYRITLELIIVIFDMSDSLKAIRADSKETE